MKVFGIFLVCLFALGLGACRKKSEAVEKEVREAGYEMTVEGWFEVIRGNGVEVMRKMVAGGFDEKTRDSQGLGGLHVAAQSGSTGAAEYLLNRGFSVDVKDSGGRTPMMHAVLSDQTEMVKWLLRQGADPKAKDNEGFMALMLAATHGRAKAVEELAPYHREDLDSALLLASLVGQPEVIDTLTSYGASVYARMEDGRTPLMLAAENGHHEAVAILMDIGASRFATIDSGETAQSFAVAAGHDEIAAMIEKGFGGQQLALESEEEIAEAMDEYLAEFQPDPEESGESALADNGDGAENAEGSQPWNEALPGPDRDGFAMLPGDTDAAGGESGGYQSGKVRTGPEGAAIGAAVGGVVGRIEPGQGSGRRAEVTTLDGARVSNPVSRPIAETGSENGSAQEELPLVMRHFRQRELPVQVKKVSGEIASLRLVGAEPREVEVRAGESIPESRLVVVKVFSRTEAGKLNEGRPMEVGVVEVEDQDSGQRREWVVGRAASSHDPVALVEDGATGQRYLARPGQKFFSEDGREFVVSDVRPSQLVIEEAATGEVRTLRLRGPKG